ncbi:MAG: hypothetical protein B7Z67_12365 [Acidiphilium sp. 21-60-14]|nr:MAG: hypothetical protein B7Z67_12365 [Acidiphilium sp. 21-60-14]OYV90781.1 MAG: hypothetical protein B7Z57_07265 [Acidiphilium sp. 37-60-79]OZB38652.1 MAG: hypothetical protein B7X48_12140 [Acidiphilium sp. 34-60-192]
MTIDTGFFRRIPGDVPCEPDNFCLDKRANRHKDARMSGFLHRCPAFFPASLIIAKLLPGIIYPVRRFSGSFAAAGLTGAAWAARRKPE